MPIDVTVLEVPARFGEVPTQLEWVRAALEARAPGDIVVLPEAALTGYVSGALDFDLSRFAEPLEGSQLSGLRTLARDFDTCLIGPVIERHGERCFNSQVVVAPTGELLAHYRKRHPWYPETWASPGDRPWPRFELGGLSGSLAVCFDVHFLAEEAAEVLAAVDVLFFCSAWVDDAGDSRPGHLAPLARRYGLEIVNANWGPGTPRVPGQGGSMVVDRTGAVVGRLDALASRLEHTLTPR
ncbi:MAG: carbon-nitrogen hydrolase family protein [Myxococcaceae bacterium]|nr:carbon-nitrogen hydrolase family protein [Myxococcaceae bacterium]